MGKVRVFLHFISRHRRVSLAGFVALFVIGWLVWRYTPTHRQMLHSTVIVKVQQWYELSWEGKHSVFFTRVVGDSTLTGLSTDSLAARSLSYSVGSWLDHWALVPSCNGRLVTSVPDSCAPDVRTATSLLIMEKNRLEGRLRKLHLQSNEIHYFLHSHGVQDEGFGSVAEYSAKIDARYKSAQALKKVLYTWNGKTPLKLTPHSAYTLYYYNWKDKPDSDHATLVASSERGQLRLLQNESHTLPIGMSAVKPLPWTTLFSGKALTVSYPGINEPAFANVWLHPTLIPLPSRKDSVRISPLLSGEGAPLFTEHGRFVGILSKGKMIKKSKVMHLFSKEAAL